VFDFRKASIPNARNWFGIHYRFSTKVGTDMGRKVADYTAQNYLQPLK
jgi:hypothetical protein